jgi:hypothetical protein
MLAHGSLPLVRRLATRRGLQVGGAMSVSRSSSRSVVLAAVGVLTMAALTRGQSPQLGYDDTPFQPDGQWRVHDSRRPQPSVVAPGEGSWSQPPADALVLLGPASDLSQWQGEDGSPVTWVLSDGVVETGKGYIETRKVFADVQLHVEFATPAAVEGESQGRGNSGVFLAGVFEVQVLDSFQNPTYPDGQAAALYGQFPPLVNAARKPGDWQSYDIVFTAPRFAESGRLVSPAVATVFHNGVLVHHARTFWGPTAHRRVAAYEPTTARGPVRLQDHNNPVRYRNVWVRELQVD